LGNDRLDPLFLGVVEAVDEAVLNAMLRAETMVGHQGHRVAAIDGEALARMVQAGR
jgi:L-aminopeptidase/D-esterase-like protein